MAIFVEDEVTETREPVYAIVCEVANINDPPCERQLHTCYDIGSDRVFVFWNDGFSPKCTPAPDFVYRIILCVEDGTSHALPEAPYTHLSGELYRIELHRQATRHELSQRQRRFYMYRGAMATAREAMVKANLGSFTSL